MIETAKAVLCQCLEFQTYLACHWWQHTIQCIAATFEIQGHINIALRSSTTQLIPLKTVRITMGVLHQLSSLTRVVKDWMRLMEECISLPKLTDYSLCHQPQGGTSPVMGRDKEITEVEGYPKTITSWWWLHGLVTDHPKVGCISGSSWVRCTSNWSDKYHLGDIYCSVVVAPVNRCSSSSAMGRE